VRRRDGAARLLNGRTRLLYARLRLGEPRGWQREGTTARTGAPSASHTGAADEVTAARLGETAPSVAEAVGRVSGAERPGDGSEGARCDSGGPWRESGGPCCEGGRPHEPQGAFCLGDPRVTRGERFVLLPSSSAARDASSLHARSQVVDAGSARRPCPESGPAVDSAGRSVREAGRADPSRESRMSGNEPAMIGARSGSWLGRWVSPEGRSGRSRRQVVHSRRQVGHSRRQVRL
jgi:hypothetical protein